MASTYVQTPGRDADFVPRSPQLEGLTYGVKLVIDRLIAAVLLLLLLPLFLVVALMIRLDSRGPALFRQTRVSRRGRLFVMYKFRSMVADAEKLQPQLAERFGLDGNAIFKLRQDPRVTRVGSWLRRSSIDELPQLINVLRGDMSLVGPRPPLASEVHLEGRHMARLAAQPGMTGLWQVSGRSELMFEDMLRLDLEYINRWSFALDYLILLRTIPTVIGKRGAY
ncbi:MAG TPA: sugar transferase [Dehalococcoidia bacterium]|nr:sugar transferase [Dehalococcoidia bacterium]